MALPLFEDEGDGTWQLHRLAQSARANPYLQLSVRPTQQTVTRYVTRPMSMEQDSEKYELASYGVFDSYHNDSIFCHHIQRDRE